jgi:hypothetical protein
MVAFFPEESHTTFLRVVSIHTLLWKVVFFEPLTILGGKKTIPFKTAVGIGIGELTRGASPVRVSFRFFFFQFFLTRVRKENNYRVVA